MSAWEGSLSLQLIWVERAAAVSDELTKFRSRTRPSKEKRVEAVRVGVVMGGTSNEREVSLRSGQAVIAALEDLGHDVVGIDLASGMDALSLLSEAEMDVAFLALHGKHGEDGCVQGVLEMLGIPYTGSGLLSSALCMDKLKAKELMRLHNILTPPYYVVERAFASDVDELHGSFGFPVVVKPRREGSSVGVALANNLSELSQALETALLFDDSILVERFVRGAEVAVAVLDGRVLGAIEIAPASELYDYNAKYESKETQYFLPARISETRLKGVLNLAHRAIEALDVRGAARVDMIVTESSNEYVLETNTLPGMTESSLLPKIAAQAGYDFPALCQSILDCARLDSGMGMRTVAQAVSLFSEPSVWEEAAAQEAEFASDRGYNLVASAACAAANQKASA